MKIEKKVIEVETVEFEKEDVAILEKAYNIVTNLINKFCDEEYIVTTPEENQIYDFIEKIHRAYETYENY